LGISVIKFLYATHNNDGLCITLIP